MKNRSIKTIALTGLVAAVSSLPFVAPKVVSAEEIRSPHKIGVEMGISSYTYMEPSVMQLEGLMRKVGASYDYEPEKKGFTLGISGSYAAEDLDYTSNKTGSMKDRGNQIKEVEVKAGYKMPLGDNSSVTLYGGSGYRRVEDKGSGMSSCVGDQRYHAYDRENELFYMLGGVETKIEMDSGWFYGVDLKGKWLLKGTQTSSFDDNHSTYPEVKNTQKKGAGIKASVEIGKKTKLGDFSVEPYVDYWIIGCSEPADARIRIADEWVNPVYEPGNNTLEAGVNFVWKF